MNSKTLILLAIAATFLSFATHLSQKNSLSGEFNPKKDLLLVQFDCKTDVDDLHTVAAFATLLTDTNFSSLKYHAVAGTYGIQEGLYVPPNDLFQLAFGSNWTDAHNQSGAAADKVKVIVQERLDLQGDIWIAEAGQSDFTALLIEAIQKDLPEINTAKRIHVIQHSDWNENSTSPERLQFVKENADYLKIPDGNAEGNGTPGFRDPEFTNWKEKIRNPDLFEIWKLAIDLSNQYNGKDGRYNNEAVSAGGLDFSDLSEVCWILDQQDIRDVEQFFNLYAH
ncbi:hypothetical protein [Marinoscillum sp.]|uniref:hypothetical protein n=1 Tax=Marinoscillum sp. TaxID=2024838 RepID=UPI003BAD12AE